MKKLNKVTLQTQRSSFDFILFFAVVGLSIFGLLMVADASAVQAQSSFGDKFFYAKGQAVALVVGIVGFLISSFLPTNFWEKITIPLFLGILFFLVLVFIPGIGVDVLGAKRWINIGGFNFQPAEPSKLVLILYLSKLLSRGIKLVPFFVASFLVFGLVVIEPDFGTAGIIIATSFTMFFVSGARLLIFSLLIPSLFVGGLSLVWFSGYRRERLLTYLGEIKDPLNSSYHISQVLIALSTGGLFGVGLGQSRAKYLFLPEASTDSIFAVIGEELGFIGAVALILIFVLIVVRMIRIALRSQDPFAKLSVFGIASWITIQALVNMAAMTATIPITGIPLPFISYGGTALVVTLVASGIVLGISRRQVVTR